MTKTEERLHAKIASDAELVGSIAHDLKGLLNGVEGGLYFIDSGIKKNKPERLTRGLEMLRRNIERIQKTVASELYYIKDRENAWLPVEIEKLTESVKQALAGHIEQTGVKLEVSSVKETFDGDEFALFSLLNNFLEYAIHACHLAQLNPPPAVSLQVSTNNHQVTFEMVAHGFTMDKETEKLAFGPHYSPKGVDRSHLKLFIANKLVTRHRGTLEVNTSEAQGTTQFRITLPRTKPNEETGLNEESQMSALEYEWESND